MSRFDPNRNSHATLTRNNFTNQPSQSQPAQPQQSQPAQPQQPVYSEMYVRLLERPTLPITSCNVNEKNCTIRINDTQTGTVINTTMLFCACYEGQIGPLKSLLRCKTIDANGPQEETGLTPLHAANLNGNIDIIAMLLFFGCKPQADNLGRFPKQVFSTNIQQHKKRALIKFWSRYLSKGIYHVLVEYNEIFSDMFEISQLPRVDPKAIEKQIQQYIDSETTEPNLNNKCISSTFKPTDGTSLFEAIEALLRFYQHKRLETTTLKEIFQQALADVSVPEGEPKPSIFQIVVQTFSINLFVLVVNPEIQSHESVKPIKYYSNRINKDSCPYLYLAFNGAYYVPIEERHVPQNYTPINVLFEMIETSESSDCFHVALTGADINEVNKIHSWKPSDSNFTMQMTLLYLACRLGKTDFANVLLQFDSVKIDGTQEIFAQNSPLHVASWRGHYNIVVMLLFKGANADQINKNGEKPRIWDAALPSKTRTQMDKIWKTYEQGKEAFQKEFKDFMIVEKPELLASSVGNSAPIPSHVFYTETITLDQLCNLLENQNPVSPNEFKQIIEKRVDITQISVVSAIHKASPLYIACRNGHYHLVKILIENGKAKLTGPQETRSGDGNTCLHVANWRGHVRVAALLLMSGATFEPKSGGNKAKPNAIVERNPVLPEERRTALATVFAAAERNQMQTVKEISEFAEKTDSALGSTLPLWAYLGLPKEELPLQYCKMDYIWYQKENNDQRLTILDVIKCSHLNTLYKRYLGGGDSSPQEIEVEMPEPPVVSFFSGTSSWTYKKWLINFSELKATFDNHTVFLAPVSRAKSWYYTSLPVDHTKPLSPHVVQSPLLTFPNKINNTISDAFTGNMPAVTFPYLIGRQSMFNFRSPAICLVNFKQKEVTITQTGSSPTSHVLYNDDDYNKKLPSMWEPSAFLPRVVLTYQPDKVTLVRLENTSEEYLKVAGNFYLTMPQKDAKGNSINKINSVQRVFFPDMSKQWETQLSQTQAKQVAIDKKFGLTVSYTKLLWHGTGTTDPIRITNSGWKINYSNTKNLWGRGIYFTTDASYASNFAYQDRSTGLRKMFLAQVITGVGLHCPENSNIVDTPKGYNSLVGNRQGSWVYVIYENSCAFPTYLVEWSDN